MAPCGSLGTLDRLTRRAASIRPLANDGAQERRQQQTRADVVMTLDSLSLGPLAQSNLYDLALQSLPKVIQVKFLRTWIESDVLVCGRPDTSHFAVYRHENDTTSS